MKEQCEHKNRILHFTIDNKDDTEQYQYICEDCKTIQREERPKL